ncbi:HtaA domain-containing protein [Streptomyces sp. NPDC021020]|uniref:HtaA domain-containing protein n=1 Tax=Streptomyces sp. NPDC021020 TaxID=3365109 RepID=UPI0037A3BC55
MPSLRHARVRIAGAFAAVVAAAAAVLGATPAAQAAGGVTVSGGRLDWGIKASFQSYVTGPIAHGSWSLTGSADTVGSEQFRFPSAQGSYDPASGALNAGFSGGVHFVGHKQSNGVYQLDLTISRPSVRISGRSGTLYADMSSKDKDSGKVTVSRQVPLASLALGGVDTRGVTGPRLALTGVPATLTTQGARAFAGYYTAGTALDPVTLSVDLHPKQATTAPSKSPTAKATSRAPGSIADGAVDWGVRRTFREYVTGDIAQGSWQLAGGAKEGGALFRFGSGKGTYDAARHTLDASFSGSVRFLGMRGQDGAYGLDLTLHQVRVTVAGGKGTLYANGQPFVTFPAAPVVKGGLVTVDEAAATLTAQGAAAFGGLYAAGTAMDPVTLSVALDPGVALPALPDIGSDAPTTAPAATTTPPPSRSPQPVASSGGDGGGGGTSAGLIAGVAAAVAAVAALAAALLVRTARRRRTAADPDDTDPSAPNSPAGDGG